MGPISLESLTVIGLLMVLFWTLGDLILVSAKLKLTRTHHTIFFIALLGIIFYAALGNFGAIGKNLALIVFWLLITAVIAKRRQYYG